MRADDPTDAELVRRTLADDREAFARLYDRHARLVRAVATDAGPGRADDAVQETFLRAYRGLADLRSPDAFTPWLVGIARKVVREAHRRPAAAPLPADLPDGRPGPDAESADEAAHLLTLVERLPPEQGQAVRSFFLSGRDANEVARLLGRSRSGTYALLRAALATLTRWMEVKR